MTAAAAKKRRGSAGEVWSTATFVVRYTEMMIFRFQGGRIAET
jgi:hypothetical protein